MSLRLVALLIGELHPETDSDLPCTRPVDPLPEVAPKFDCRFKYQLRDAALTSSLSVHSRAVWIIAECELCTEKVGARTADEIGESVGLGSEPVHPGWSTW
jgi:hypothetical protein